MQGKRQNVLSAAALPLAMLLCAAPAGAADYAKQPEYAVPSGTVVIHAGTLLAVPGEAPARRQSIIVREGLVVEVRDGFVTADERGGEAARIIDLSESFVMPGFIDLHVHLTGQAGSGGRDAYVRMTDADVAFTAQM